MTGNMSVPRSKHTMSILQNGKVLVTGGYYFGGDLNLDEYYALDSAELYDPKTGTWKTTSRMNYTRSKHTTSILKNGTVLVTGGFPDTAVNDALGTTELYNPSTEDWI